MKKLGKILGIVCLTMAVAVCAFMFAACDSGKTYTASYDIESKKDTPASPIAASGDSAASGYVGSLGRMVDKVSCEATLVIDGEKYTFTWQVHCGSDTEENPVGTYAPEYVWTGKVIEATDTSIKLGAAETAKVTIHATKQNANNAEVIAGWGAPDAVATHESTEAIGQHIKYGKELLELFSAGTYEVSGTTLVNYTLAN